MKPSLSLETQVNFFNAMPLWGKMQILENLSFKADGLGRGVIQQGSFVSKKKSYPIQNILAKLKGKEVKEFNVFEKHPTREQCDRYCCLGYFRITSLFDSSFEVLDKKSIILAFGGLYHRVPTLFLYTIWAYCATILYIKKLLKDKIYESERFCSWLNEKRISVCKFFAKQNQPRVCLG